MYTRRCRFVVVDAIQILRRLRQNDIAGRSPSSRRYFVADNAPGIVSVTLAFVHGFTLEGLFTEAQTPAIRINRNES